MSEWDDFPVSNRFEDDEWPASLEQKKPAANDKDDRKHEEEKMEEGGVLLSEYGQQQDFADHHPEGGQEFMDEYEHEMDPHSERGLRSVASANTRSVASGGGEEPPPPVDREQATEQLKSAPLGGGSGKMQRRNSKDPFEGIPGARARRRNSKDPFDGVHKDAEAALSQLENSAPHPPEGQKQSQQNGGRSKSQEPGGRRQPQQKGGRSKSQEPGGHRQSQQNGGRGASQETGARRQSQQPGGRRQSQQPGARRQSQQPEGRRQPQPPEGRRQSQQPEGRKQSQQPEGRRQSQQPEARRQSQQPEARRQSQQPEARRQPQQPGARRQSQQPGGRKQSQQPGGQKQSQQPGAFRQSQPPGGQKEPARQKEPAQQEQREKNPRYKDVENTGQWGRALGKYEKIGIIAFILVIFLVVILVIVLVVKPGSSPAPAPAPAPVQEAKAPTPAPTMREAYGYDLIRAASPQVQWPGDPDTLVDVVLGSGSTTPQHAAAKFVLYDDPNPVGAGSPWFLQKYGLYTMWLALGGNRANGAKGWINEWDWARQSRPCSFHGVKCDLAETYVTEIDLGSNGLATSKGRGTEGVPFEISTLKKMWSFEVDDNDIGGPIPSRALAAMESLTTATFKSNRLTGQIPSQLSNTNLAFLSLDENQLTGTVPEDLCAKIKTIVVNCEKNPCYCCRGPFCE